MSRCRLKNVVLLPSSLLVGLWRNELNSLIRPGNGLGKTLQTSMPKEKKEKTSKEPIRNRINVVRSSASSHMMILHTSYWLWKNNWILPDPVPCLSLFYLYGAQARHTITPLHEESNVSTLFWVQQQSKLNIWAQVFQKKSEFRIKTSQENRRKIGKIGRKIRKLHLTIFQESALTYD